MARLPRLTVPGVPHHILQRGNNRQLIFHGTADYQCMLSLLWEHARAHKVAIHAFVLMGSHFRLLATPETNTGIAQTMQALGRGYVRYFNQAQGRTGTLWEGRYRSALIEPERYLLPVMVQMDLEPVRAHLVAEPADYAWSSHAHYAGRTTQRFLHPHPIYWALGNTPFSREAAYAERVQTGLRPDEERLLADRLPSSWPLGSPEHCRFTPTGEWSRGIPDGHDWSSDVSPNLEAAFGRAFFASLTPIVRLGSHAAVH
jgi:putative transposase